MRTHFGLFLLFFGFSAQAEIHPSLLKDCNFSNFLENRMFFERETFWRRSQNHEEHFLGAERKYDEELSEQAVDCFEKFLETDFRGCNLNSIPDDAARFQRVESEYGEFDFWKFSRGSFPFGKAISDARNAYLQKMGTWLTSCFKKEELSKLNHHSVENLSTATLGAKRDSSCGHFGCRVSYRIEMNGIVLQSTYDSEDDEFTLSIDGKEIIRRDEK